jgi:hypothetical protein
VYDVHRTCGGDENHEFPGLASKPVVTICQLFGHKTIAMFSWFGPQNQGPQFGGLTSKPLLWFGDLGLKITVTVFWFGHQNQVKEVCQFAPQNRWTDEDDVRARIDIQRLASVRNESG